MTGELAHKLWRMAVDFEAAQERAGLELEAEEPKGETFEFGYALASVNVFAHCGRGLRHALEDAGIQKPEDM